MRVDLDELKDNAWEAVTPPGCTMVDTDKFDLVIAELWLLRTAMYDDDPKERAAAVKALEAMDD